MTDVPTPTPAPPSRPSPMLIVFLLLPLLGIGAAIAMIAHNEQQRAALYAVPDLPSEVERRAAALMNYAAPEFSVDDLDGQPVSLADYRGRVVFLNFWQTTCEPCQRELPAFVQFGAEQGAAGAVVLAVNLGETPEQVTRYMTENAITGLRVPMDREVSIGPRYGVIGLPVTFVIDGAGIVRAMKIGEITLEEMDDYLAAALDQS